MKEFIFRFITLSIRFICPLATLALSNIETTGKYYLFASYFALASGVSSLELAVPFSRKYLCSKNIERQRIIFSIFILGQVLVSMALAFLACIVLFVLIEPPILLIPLLYLAIVSEACTIETNRFLWNTGRSHTLSKLDLLRAISFTLAILISVYSTKEVMTNWTLLIIFTSNLFIILWGWRKFGGMGLRDGKNIIKLLKRTMLSIRLSLRISISQFLHMQILNLQTFFERVLLEKTMGLASVGIFSLLSSIIQAANHLLLVPKIAKIKEKLLSAVTISQRISVNSEAKQLSVIILAISVVSAIIGYASLPLINLIMNKELEASHIIVLVACLSCASSTFYSSIAPLFSRKGYARIANSLSMTLACTLLLTYILQNMFDFELLGLVVIGIVGILQFIGRIIFLNYNSRYLEQVENCNSRKLEK